MIKPKKPISPEKAKVRLEELCARSEQCTGDAYKKLQTWGIARSDAETIVKSLVDRRFIDDERFCHAFVRDKMRFARWGRRKIKAALMMNVGMIYIVYPPRASESAAPIPAQTAAMGVGRILAQR